jgi:phage tail-like protein
MKGRHDAMRPTGVPSGLTGLTAVAGGWVAGALPLPPYQTFNFAVELEGVLVGGFTEVTGLESTIEVEEYREGGVNGFVHHLPGRTSYSNLTLRHGLTSLGTLWNWYSDTTEGVISRRNGTIMLLNTQQVPVMWWNFRNALPVRWTGPTFNATSDEVGVEELELTHEGFTTPLLSQTVGLAQGIAAAVTR